ncbi:MAG: YadA-like family protein, partial [Novosphingobium sp.]|nr:YadA-like family protein [Novosphingobium sp.]
SVRIGDIAASTAAQVGPVEAVTVDASGTLGKAAVASTSQLNALQSSMARALAVTDAQFNQLSTRVGAIEGRLEAIDGRLDRFDRRLASSTAVAVAMGGAAFLPDMKFNLTANMGTYDGAHAGSIQLGALISRNVAVNAGVATGFNKNGKTAGRVGLTIGW